MNGRRLAVTVAVAALLVVGAFTSTYAQGESYEVQSGDTLYGVARQFGVSVADLASANGISSSDWLYTGQRLVIPTPGESATAPATEAVPSGQSYIVQRGDSLYSIAIRHATTVDAIKQANGLSGDTIYIGQRLLIPGSGNTSIANVPPPPYAPYKGEKWIDVNLTYQTISAYEGGTMVKRSLVSTGLPRTPTVTGTYGIYVKYAATDMEGGSHEEGDYYYLEDVPYTMYFHRGYGIHGTYWHSNFGQPMSHGCVNLTIADAQWFYEWASLGTKVISHY